MYAKLGSVVISVLLVAGLATSSLASGFAIIEQSVSGLGNAFSGGAASAEDASTVYFNPAGMTLLDGQQVVAGAHVIVPSTKFTATTATNALGGSLGTNNGGDGGVIGLVPNLYYTNKLTDKFFVGLGINAPFGLATKYDNDWVGRYHAIESDVLTININPSIAYKVTDKLSFGAGLNAQYIDATLSSMADVGLSILGTSSPATDVFVENKADDWSFGYNLGLLYEFSKTSRVGFAYRSEIKHKLGGTVTTSIPTTPVAALGGASLSQIGAVQALFPASQGVNGKITLPASASLSLFHQLNDKLAVMADISWTEWSSFKKLTLNFEGTGIGGSTTTTTTENWDDTWRYSAGASYQATEALLLRTGIAYDETPISDKYRTPRIPGEDRLWLSLGAGYQLTENMNLDFAYAHLFVSDSKMEKLASVPEDTARGTVIGEFKNSVDIASVQMSYKF